MYIKYISSCIPIYIHIITGGGGVIGHECLFPWVSRAAPSYASQSSFWVLSVCCSVLQFVAACCRVLPCVAVRCSAQLFTSIIFPGAACALQRVAVCCCSVLQCVAVCCSASQRVATWCMVQLFTNRFKNDVCCALCSLLQPVAACCNVVHTLTTYEEIHK